MFISNETEEETFRIISDYISYSRPDLEGINAEVIAIGVIAAVRDGELLYVGVFREHQDEVGIISFPDDVTITTMKPLDTGKATLDD